MPKPVLILINPKSGTGKSSQIPELIEKHLDKSFFEPTVRITEYAGHATEICREEHSKYDYIIAVGGDGTVNEIARELVNTNCIMGIIPRGSGNGLAFALGISSNLQKSIKTLSKYKVHHIDTGLADDVFFANVSGIGFDAHISHQFANFGKRGLISYAKLSIREFFKFKETTFKLKYNGISTEKKAFMISVANSSQFGNNAHIAPGASLTDGLFDVVILKKFKLVQIPVLVYKLFAKKLTQSKILETFKCQSLEIESSEPMFAHIDGEPVKFSSRIKYEIKPKSLLILGK